MSEAQPIPHTAPAAATTLNLRVPETAGEEIRPFQIEPVSEADLAAAVIQPSNPWFKV